jgi:GxxExxY protein
MAQIPPSIIHKELSYEVIAICLEVHTILGPGYSEKIYEEAVVRDLQRKCIPFERQKCIDVLYKGDKLGDHRIDIVVDKKIILELKAVSDLNSTFEAQVFSYLKSTKLKLGILINFGKKKLEQKRIVN